MSDIVRARELLVQANALERRAVDLLQQVCELQKQACVLREKAVVQMARQSPVRRADAEVVQITPEMRLQVHRLARESNKTVTDIAREVGLRNGGRVSEILNDKR